MRRTTRRRPKLATTLGSAAALALLAFYTGASWPWRIGVTVGLLALLIGYYLWSRPHEVDSNTDDEIQAEREEKIGD